MMSDEPVASELGEHPGDEEGGGGGEAADQRRLEGAASGRVPVNRPLM